MTQDTGIGRLLIEIVCGLLVLVLALAVITAIFAVGAAILVGFAFAGLLFLLEIASPGAGAEVWVELGTLGQTWLLASVVLGFALALLPSASEPY